MSDCICCSSDIFSVFKFRSVEHHVAALIVLGECDEVADALLSAEEGAETVKAECDASVRRSTVLESVDQEAEAVVRILMAEAEDLEHTLLYPGIVDTDGAAAHLGAVEHEVVGIGAHTL